MICMVVDHDRNDAQVADRSTHALIDEVDSALRPKPEAWSGAPVWPFRRRAPLVIGVSLVTLSTAFWLGFGGWVATRGDDVRTIVLWGLLGLLTGLAAGRDFLGVGLFGGRLIATADGVAIQRPFGSDIDMPWSVIEKVGPGAAVFRDYRWLKMMHLVPQFGIARRGAMPGLAIVVSSNSGLPWNFLSILFLYRSKPQPMAFIAGWVLPAKVEVVAAELERLRGLALISSGQRQATADRH